MLFILVIFKLIALFSKMDQAFGVKKKFKNGGGKDWKSLGILSDRKSENLPFAIVVS